MSILQVFNQFSAIMLPTVILIVAAIVLLRRRARPVAWVTWGLVLVGVVVFALVNRVPQTATAKLDTAADIRVAIQGAGRPTLIEFYSNY
jgi:hypothetical protein